MERFKHKRLNDMDIKEQNQVKTTNNSQLWRTWMMMMMTMTWTSIGLWIVLEYKTFSYKESRLL
jgi:hypothetical protein